jgi:two-component system NarL family sensor kinase
MPAYSQHDDLAESYRRLADVFHDLLAEESLDAVLSRIASALADLVPHDSITVYEADDSREELVPVFAHDQWAENILSTRIRFDEGITGWAASKREPVLCNQAHLDPRVKFVPGTPSDEAEALSIINISEPTRPY